MKKRRKPLILLGFPAEFLAFPRWFEHPTYRLGGGRSIQLSYGNIFKIYSILVLNLLNVNRLCPKGGRYNIFLGGGRSILLSYGNMLPSARLHAQTGCRKSISIHPKSAAKDISPHPLLYQKILIRQDTNLTDPIIHICPLKRRPIAGSPIRSLRLIATWKITSLQSSFRL